MTVDNARAAVITGDGVVARYPGLLCVARCADREVLLKLLDVCAAAAGADPGRVLARRLAKWMGGPDAPGDDLEFGTVATAGAQLGVFLVGSVEVAVPGGPVALSGSDAATWTDRLISVPGAPVLLALDGARPPAGIAEGVNDLRAGVVPGAGAVLFPAGRAAAARPDAGSVLDGPTIRTPAHSGAARPAAAPDLAVANGAVPNGAVHNVPAPNGTVHSGTGSNGVVRNGSPWNGSPSDADTRRPRTDPGAATGYEWFADWSDGGGPAGDGAGPGPAAPAAGRWPWSEPPADRARPRLDDRLGAPEEAPSASPEDRRADPFRPDLARPDAARPDSTASESVRPDAARPDAVRPDLARPDAAWPDAGRSESDRPASAPPGRAEEAQPDRVDAAWLGRTADGRSDAAWGDAHEGVADGRVGEGPLDPADGIRSDGGPWAEPPTPAGGSIRTAPSDERTRAWADPADPFQEGRHSVSPDVAPAASGEQRAHPLAAHPAPDRTGHHDAVPGAARIEGADDATPVNAVAAVEPREPVAAPEAPAQPRPAPEERAPAAADDGPRDHGGPGAGVPVDGPSGDGLAAGTVPDGRGAVADAAPPVVRTPTPTPRPHDPADVGDTPADPDEPLLRGRLCEEGHLNDPRATSCVACGAPVEPGEDVVGPRPPLGRIVFDDGATFTVDAEYLVGRMPEADPRARSGELQPIVVEDRSGSVSRVHAEILINGWDVVLVDSGSRNGTFVARPDDSGWTPLAPGRTSLLLPGSRVRMGGRTFVFEPPVAVG